MSQEIIYLYTNSQFVHLHLFSIKLTREICIRVFEHSVQHYAPVTLEETDILPNGNMSLSVQGPQFDIVLLSLTYLSAKKNLTKITCT